MLSVIKTAIITIIISFISGVLLDNYKNFAPRILCTIRKTVPIKLNNKKIKVYILKIKNTSNKTLHDLNVNIQSQYEKMKINNTKITNGLKYDLVSEDNVYNVSIPFLSKNDEFSLNILVDNISGVNKKPMVTLRSPENFKRVDSSKNNGFISSLFASEKTYGNTSKSIYSDKRKNKVYNRNDNVKKNIFLNKTTIIAFLSILIAVYAGILGKEYYNKIVSGVNSAIENQNPIEEPEKPKSTPNTSANNEDINSNKKSVDADKNDKTSDKTSNEKTNNNNNKNANKIETNSENKTESNKSKTTNNKIDSDKTKDTEKNSESQININKDNNINNENVNNKQNTEIETNDTPASDKEKPTDNDKKSNVNHNIKSAEQTNNNPQTSPSTASQNTDKNK